MPSSTVEPVITVKESDPLRRAVTLMELYDFSQLPVVRGSGKQPKGVVTWETIGRTLAIDPDATLKDCIDSNPPTFGIDDDLMDAIEEINRVGYSLVVKRNKELSGIVTSADLGATLTQIAKPFLMLGQLEEHLSRIIHHLQAHNLMHQDELRANYFEHRGEVEISVDALTLGEKIKHATGGDTWHQVTSIYDRTAVTEALERAVGLRNRLMHFRPLRTSDRHALASLPSLTRTLSRISKALQDE